VSDTSSTADPGFYAKPFWWLLFALVLLAVPAVAFMLNSGMAWEEMHPAINAMLNGSSAVFLLVGFWAIKGKRRELHRHCMLGAFTASGVFLISYLARFYMSGTHRYPGDGWDKALYLIILFSHMILAAVLVPMALRSIYLALKGRYQKHRRIARWTWPVWIYVSITGVIVYLMLYPIAGAVYN
jgi:putative membrane protein